MAQSENFIERIWGEKKWSVNARVSMCLNKARGGFSAIDGQLPKCQFPQGKYMGAHEVSHPAPNVAQEEVFKDLERSGINLYCAICCHTLNKYDLSIE